MASVFGRAFTVPRAELTSVARRPAVLAVVIAVVGILGVHAETAASIVSIWWRSETFAHGFVVVPVGLWLVWQRRAVLEQALARPFFPGLLLVALFGAMWLVATLSDVQAGRQFALLFMIEAAVLTVVGPAVVRQIAFPLVFLWFAVPFGEFLIPTMIDRTADFTVAALRASGVPVYREANHFVIPSGSWSVVEACSGIRYLIVSVMIGTVYAMVTYRSATRKALFIGASIVVPIVANWLRAYGIVMLGHLSNNKLAVGVDHLIYGWLFFGVVMVALFSLGALFQETGQKAQVVRPASTTIAGAVRPSRLFLAAALSIIAAGSWLPLLASIERVPSQSSIALPALAGTGSWRPTPDAFTAWKPQYTGQVAELRQTFASGNDMAGIYVAFYRNQREGRELVMSKNALVAKNNWSWKLLDSRIESISWNGSHVDARRATLAGRDGQLTVYQLYWIDGNITASDWVAKVLSTWAKLRGSGDDSALIVVFAPAREAEERSTLRDFVTQLSPEVHKTLDAVRKGAP